MIKKLSVLLAIIYASSTVSLALTLDEAVQQAVHNNPEIQSAQNKWKSAAAVVPKAYFPPDPKLGADFEGIPEGSADLRQAMMRYYNFTQEIPWPGMLASDGQAAAARADMFKYAYLAKEREIIKAVKAAYYELAKTDQLIKIMNLNITLMKLGYKAAQARYAAGEASQAEALKMQIELNRMENELQNMKDERLVKNLELGLLFNSASEETYQVEPMLELAAVAAGTEIENSPRLKMEKSALEEVRAMKGSALSSYFPETMLKWRSQKAGTAVGSNDIMLDFSVPLWFLARQNRQLEEADKNIAAGEANYQAMKNMLRREVKDLSTMQNIAWRKLKLYDTSLLASAKAALEGSLAGYKGGKVEFMLLLDSFRSYLDINKEYYETLADYYTRSAELEEITGRD